MEFNVRSNVSAPEDVRSSCTYRSAEKEGLSNTARASGGVVSSCCCVMGAGGAFAASEAWRL